MSAKAGVWQRTYYSKLFGGKSYPGKTGVGLTILTNKGKAGKDEDMYIEYVTITYGGKVIGGGEVYTFCESVSSRPPDGRMTPGARIAAAIEILADIETRHRPAADALKDWGLVAPLRRIEGSCRAGTLVFDALRCRASAAWIMGERDASRDRPRQFARDARPVRR